VRPDGSVRVTIPRRGSKREAEAFVTAQREWIERQRARVAQEHRDRPAPMAIEELRAWRRKAQRELPPRLLELAAAFALTVNRVSIRNQRWRWGSCSRNGHITLNWRLVTMPDWVRDYVLIHELMHLKRMDHSPQFWTLVAIACPDYQAARKWLRANGSP
jgi:predicted metal-dependent hydrolase